MGIRFDNDGSDVSRNFGFQGVWPRHKNNKIENNILIPNFEDIECYYPMSKISIVNDFKQLKDGDESLILEFTNLYGSLGFSYYAEIGDRVGGDPIWWIIAHAKAVQTCMEIQKVIEENNEGLMKDLVKSMTFSLTAKEFHKSMAYLGEMQSPNLDAVISKKCYSILEGADKRMKVILVPDISDRDLLLTIQMDFLNSNIQNIKREFILERIDPKDESNTNNKIHSYFDFKALLDVIYWKLADKIDGGVIKRCAAEGCGGIFIQTDKRMIYCPPLSGHKESSCAARERMRKARLADKTEEKD